jgi:RNA polymerase sigma-70 factor (ECF subfamily)
VDRALAGDRAAFAEVVRGYARLVYAQAYAVVRQPQEAEDIVQETFIRAYRYRIRLRDPGKLQAWLLSIARNLARDALRRRRPDATLQADDADLALIDEGATLPGATLEEAERRLLLTAALAKLPERHRQAITCRYLLGMDHHSIEHKMGISNGALRGVLGRALQMLRRRLRPDTAMEKDYDLHA